MLCRALTSESVFRFPGYPMFIGPWIIVTVEEWKTNLMSLAILFHFLCSQRVSDINISIIRSLRLCCWITTSVVLFRKDGWFSVSVNLQCIHRKFTLTLNHPSLQNKTTDVVIQQHSRKLLMMDILISETRWAHKKWKKKWHQVGLSFFNYSSISLVFICDFYATFVPPWTQL